MSENKPEMIPEQGIPEIAPALHDWIVAELGDTELARKVSEHPEITAQVVSGEGLPSPDFFGMVRAIGNQDPMLAHELIQVGLNAKRLLTLQYAHVAGNASEENKKKHLIEASFLATERAGIVKIKNEKEKTVEQIEMVNYAVEQINIIRKSYGLDEFYIAPEQVRFIADQFLYNATAGKFFVHKQEVVLGEDDSAPVTLNKVLHELIHFGGYTSVQLDADPVSGGLSVSDYRFGLAVRSRVKGTEERAPIYLNGLSEAVTEELANRMRTMIPDEHHVFGKMLIENDALREKFISLKRVAYEKRNFRDHWTIPCLNEKGELVLGTAYTRERLVLFALFQKIYDHTERKNTMTLEEAEEELFEMLTKAYFTGNVLPFGRLFNDTFGRGQFREFGHLQTVEEQKAFIDAL